MGGPAAVTGKNFGQYHININVTPPNDMINGTEKITYVNNSPDTLKTLTFKVLMNIHKPGAARH